MKAIGRQVAGRFRRWLATDLEPHAHDGHIHAHVWGRQRHDHKGTRWGR